MIQASLMQSVLEAAAQTGADFAELFYEDTVVNSIDMTDGEVENAGYARKVGAGVRVLLGTRSAYAYTADTSEEALIATAKAAAAALKGKDGAKLHPFSEKAYSTPVLVPFVSIGNDRRVELLRSATKAARAEAAELTQVTATYFDKVQRVLIANTEGLIVTDERPRTRSSVSAIAMKDGRAQTGFEAPGRCMGFEAYRDSIDLEQAARRAAHTCATMLHAKDCPAGVMPVVIDGGFGGVIFHEACGHSLEATSVGRGLSVFCGKLGQKIAADCVTAIDDGTMPGAWGSINVDDEGYESHRNVLIENGVLKSYMIDRLGSRRMGMAPTGNSRRQDYTYAPTSRMTNTFIDAGKDDPEEMIRTMGEGLYAAKMGGGSVNPVTGEFNFAVLEGYYVRDGKILCPVKGATLIGKGTDILTRIDRVGPKMWVGQGMCGSLSGSVPTNVGQPRIRVQGITVGGKGGAI